MQIIIKWNGQKYPIAYETSDTGLTLKAKIFSVTNVPAERQKIMIKGGLLKDDSKLDFKPDQVIMMMGTVDISSQSAPKEKVVFLEDMKNPSVAIGIPAGITNLGNTCYLNATMQCLRTVKELPMVLNTISADPLIKNFGSATKAFYDELKIGNTVHPIVFLQLLRQVYPQFAEQDRNGYMQQDAEEAWGQIIHSFEQAQGLSIEGSIDENKRFVDQFMTCQLISEL